MFKALKAAAPKGIDVYFDNVGGDIFEACLFQMNNRGRIACCGAVSQYDGAPSPTGPRGVPGLIVVKRLIVQGFIVTDFNDQRDKALADLQAWVAVRQAQGAGGRDQRPREHAGRADRPARRREPRQADGEGLGRRPHLKRSMIPKRRSQNLARCLSGAVAMPSSRPDRPAGRAHQTDSAVGAIPNARASLAMDTSGAPSGNRSSTANPAVVTLRGFDVLLKARQQAHHAGRSRHAWSAEDGADNGPRA